MNRVSVLLDLSYQAAQQVLSAPVTTALHLLKDISQNFPSRARSVFIARRITIIIIIVIIIIIKQTL